MTNKKSRQAPDRYKIFADKVEAANDYIEGRLPFFATPYYCDLSGAAWTIPLEIVVCWHSAVQLWPWGSVVDVKR